MRYNEIIESLDNDDELFGVAPKLDRRHELRAKAIRRTAKRDLLNIQPGTRLMVKWDNGKYYKGVVNRLTPSGRLIVQVKFKNVGWPLEKNISPNQIKPEHILKENDDDDLFGKSSELANMHKEKIKQIMDPYLRTVRKIRELAKTRYGATIRVSSVPKKSARGRATVWVGDYDANYQIPKTTPEAYRVKEDLEQLGFECRFTDAGWLSVKVPPAFSDLINEEDDDDLFGDRGGNWAQAIAKTMHKLVHEASHYMKISDPVGDVRTRTDMRIAMQDCKHLAQALRTDGVTGFLNALNDVSRDTVDRIDAGLAMDHGVYLSDIEKGFGYHDHMDENDESDDELFGEDDPILRALKLLMKLKPAVKRDPDAVKNILELNKDQDPAVVREKIYNFMADAVHMSREYFDRQADELGMLPVRGNWARPWEFWDVNALTKDIKYLTQFRQRNIFLEEDDDDDLFGDRRHAMLARFFREFADYHAETARTLKRKYDRDVYRTLNLDYREIASAFTRSLEKGLARWRVLGVHNRDISAREVKERLGIDIYSLAYPRVREDAEADDELFGTNTLADRIKALLKHKQKVRIAVSGAMGWVRGMRGYDVIISRGPRSPTRFLWPGLHSERAKNFELKQDPGTGVWVVTDRADFD